jgi:DNA mismatch endonuclease (patch repair protein)
MVDVLTSEQRKVNMSRIRGRNTKPEMLIRGGLHARGLRYRLHDRKLPGRPDIIFPRYHAVILVHGCFWHGHNCPMFRMPATRQDFWSAKIGSNQARDAKVHAALLMLGWRVLTVWECSLRGKGRPPLESVLDACVDFVRGDKVTLTIEGTVPSLGFEEKPPMNGPF